MCRSLGCDIILYACKIVCGGDLEFNISSTSCDFSIFVNKTIIMFNLSLHYTASEASKSIYYTKRYINIQKTYTHNIRSILSIVYGYRSGYRHIYSYDTSIQIKYMYPQPGIIEHN